MTSSFDHLVFAAASLDEGAEWLSLRLGVPFDAGGEHTKMGTHNRLLRLGESAYIELIAINPLAANPPRRRWFGLDNSVVQKTLSVPRLVTWAVRTSDINALVAGSAITPGAIHAMTRNFLNWLITIPDDGSVTEEGLFPFAIEWLGAAHPARKLAHRGLSLDAIELCTPGAKQLEQALASIGFNAQEQKVSVISIEGPQHFRARLKTPKGLVMFSSDTLIEDGIVLPGEASGSDVAEAQS